MREASSGVEGLIRLFESDQLPGQSALRRLDWILWLTASRLPGMQMELFPPDDSGFRPELADGRFYTDPACWAGFLRPEERHTKQVGHFLTAAGLRRNRWPQFVTLNLIVGHEKRGDRLFFTFVWQFLATTREDRRRFLQAVELDRAGRAEARDRMLQPILGFDGDALPSPRRIGNSLTDLRLSVKGWRFGEAVLRDRRFDRQAAADWLRREIYDPNRPRPARPAPARGGC